MQYRVLGIRMGSVDAETEEMILDLTIDGRPPMSFVLGYGAAVQVISALGRTFFELRRILTERQPTKKIPAELVQLSHIQKDRWEDVVLMQLTTPQGIPYTFAIPSQFASEIGDQLKMESAKPHRIGHA
jgi:hypothetical protein